MLIPSLRLRLAGALLALGFATASPVGAQTSFVAFESGPVRPLALSPDGTRLFAVNTPDNRLEVFAVSASGLTLLDSIPVGMEPVAVAARSNTQVWVVNHLSDSVSIVDLASTPPRVARTLLVGDEPRDIVFAGPGGNRAFITTAHRGQHRTDPSIGTDARVRRSAAHHPGRGPRRRVGVRREQSRRQQLLRRAAALHLHLPRRHAPRAREERERRQGLCGGLPLGQPDHGHHGDGRLQRLPGERRQQLRTRCTGRRRGTRRQRLRRRRRPRSASSSSSTAPAGATRSTATGAAPFPSACRITTSSRSRRTR